MLSVVLLEFLTLTEPLYFTAITIVSIHDNPFAWVTCTLILYLFDL